MKLNRARRAQHSESIIALIDVVFFLLVFFMLIGRMDATAPFDVAPPQATSGRDMPAGGVTLAISETGDLAFDGSIIEAQVLTSALSKELAKNPALRLRINAHREADLRHVLPYISMAEAVGILDVILVVTPESLSQPDNNQ